MTGEISRCERHGYPLSFALLDIDHFKQVNDSRGHAAGDRVLTAMGSLLRSLLRLSDLSAGGGAKSSSWRSPSTDLAGAAPAAERLRAGDREHVGTSTTPASAFLSRRRSGSRSWHPGEPLESLVDRADRAMYASEAAGREPMGQREKCAARRFDLGDRRMTMPELRTGRVEWPWRTGA